MKSHPAKLTRNVRMAIQKTTLYTDLPYEASKSKRFNRFWIIHGESKLISKLFKLMKTTFIPRWAALEAVEHK